MKKNGFVMSTYVYMLLVFFLLLLATMLTVLNNTKLLSNKLRNDTELSSGLLDKNFSFVLLGDKEVTIFKDDEYEDAGYVAKTNNGKDLKENVKITGEVDNTEVGDYTITYKLTYNGISKELKRIVTVVDDFTYYINSILDIEKGNTDHLQKTTATYNGITYDAGIRYTGDNPNNYVLFNCDDDSNVSTCETWRIIGVFDVDNGNGTIEKRVKIINTASTFKASWDSSTGTVNDGWGVNQWFPSTKTDGTQYEGADLYRLLNGFYIGKSDTCTYCNGENQGTCSNTCTKDSLISANMKPLTNSAKNLISNAKWYTYGLSLSDLGAYVTSTDAGEAYLQEMGISKEYTGKECSSGTGCNDTVNRTTSGSALIGLMSASDIGYANGWLYDDARNLNPWLITPYVNSSTSRDVWCADIECIIAVPAYYSFEVFAATYLKSNVKKIGGTGTKRDPYKLTI